MLETKTKKKPNKNPLTLFGQSWWIEKGGRGPVGGGGLILGKQQHQKPARICKNKKLILLFYSFAYENIGPGQKAAAAGGM